VNRTIPFLLAAVITLAYANALHVPFQFDDWHVLEGNPSIRSLDNLPRFFTDPTATSVLPENRDLRPLLMVTFALNYAVSGNRTWSYHLVNLLLHWLACLLLYRIVRDHLWRGDDAVPTAAAAALIVAVHPLNTEPVN
jgi:protein O-mannosyl-transferase